MRAVRVVMLLALLSAWMRVHSDAVSPLDVRKVMVAGDHLYVRVGSLGHPADEYDALKSLWGADFSPEPVERIKRVDSDTLAALYGTWPEAFQLLYLEAQTAQDCVGRADHDCSVFYASVQQAHVEVEGAALYQWACDGSLVPVLDLGRWPWPQDVPDDWPQVLALAQKQPVEYVRLSSRARMMRGTLDTDQQFRHEQLTLYDEQQGNYLQLDNNMMEFVAPAITLFAGRDLKALDKVEITGFFHGRC